MLDSVTKKRIDNLRNILVGKTPSPESQVEQITTGLVYKFMHDIDRKAVEMGGRPSFFTGEYEKYAWTNLFNPKLEGADRVKLYSEAIEKMYTNPSAPPMFREIFKNAYLPFKNPSTLNMFLKGINEFDYSHSEKLGDAFEYLLSKMDSQGDAGQFRTPRHIIDFIVEIVNPQKNERILDPACGTAGFLISSYKHIQKQNTRKKLGDKLSAAERKRIGESIVGYDISPDMTRISLVNMYLHQFATPKIYEYDTLSSDDRWSEHYDVILANPPFFSPTGGIQPHSRFGVQSTRAEVLFVDYIMEHLRPKGRSGIIVPEGIIFQTGKAYKTLRKRLVEDFLVGVISLPAGAFNPYSGVKTSILILDKERSQKSDSIFFAKVENDGFSLGSQRYPIDKNDLPEVFSNFIRREEFSTKEREVFLISKRDILNSLDVGLSFSRYQNGKQGSSDFEFKKIGEVCLILNGSTPKKKKKLYWDNGTIPWFTIEDLREQGYIIRETKQKISQKALDETSVKLLPPKATLLCCTASVGACAFSEISLTTNQQFNGLVIKEEYREFLLPKYLFWISTNLKDELIRHSGSTSFNFISVAKVKEIEIPLPAIEVQQQIVDELGGYQKVIDGCRQAVENYKPTIDIDPSWEMVELKEICKIYQPKTITQKELIEDGQYPVFGANGIIGRYNQYNHELPEVAVGCRGTCGIVNFSSPFSWITGNAMVCSPKDESTIIKKFLFYYLSISDLSSVITGSAQPQITRASIENYLISLPPTDIQQEIVDRLEENQKRVDAARELAEIHAQKIHGRIGKVWGE